MSTFLDILSSELAHTVMNMQQCNGEDCPGAKQLLVEMHKRVDKERENPTIDEKDVGFFNLITDGYLWDVKSGEQLYSYGDTKLVGCIGKDAYSELNDHVKNLVTNHGFNIGTHKDVPDDSSKKNILWKYNHQGKHLIDVVTYSIENIIKLPILSTKNYK